MPRIRSRIAGVWYSTASAHNETHLTATMTLYQTPTSRKWFTESRGKLAPLMIDELSALLAIHGSLVLVAETAQGSMTLYRADHRWFIVDQIGAKVVSKEDVIDFCREHGVGYMPFHYDRPKVNIRERRVYV